MGRMTKPIELVFQSSLHASAAVVWEWMTSMHGISAELWPFLRMTAPPGLRSIADLELHPGQPLFRSRIFLFGVLPIDSSALTLIEITPGEGFVEQSPMRSMRLWRHERRLSSLGSTGEVVMLTDRLTFDPKWGRSVVAWFINKTFRHRHAVLRRHFGSA
jgi:ligand-binding SRPBCC domain-containing protein